MTGGLSWRVGCMTCASLARCRCLVLLPLPLLRQAGAVRLHLFDTHLMLPLRVSHLAGQAHLGEFVAFLVVQGGRFRQPVPLVRVMYVDFRRQRHGWHWGCCSCSCSCCCAICRRCLGHLYCGTNPSLRGIGGAEPHTYAQPARAAINGANPVSLD